VQECPICHWQLADIVVAWTHVRAAVAQMLYDSFKNEQLQMDEGVTFTDVGYTFFNTEKEGYLNKLSTGASVHIPVA